MIRTIAVLLGLMLLFPISTMAEVPVWQTIPSTPVLPAKAKQSGYAPVNGVKIWYAVYGEGKPVMMLHGGLANSNYFGLQVPVLAKHYQVIVMDSRGHGRSSRDEKPYTYQLMADDVLGLMNFLHLEKAAIIGWSDGGIIGIDLAIHHPERLKKVFAFGANVHPDGLVSGAENTPTYSAYIARTGKEYANLSSTPSQYPAFRDAIFHMWEKEPHYTDEQLTKISIPVLIVDGDHEEGIKREHTETMAALIPNAGLLIQPYVSHFSFLQDPVQFNDDVLHFLASP